MYLLPHLSCSFLPAGARHFPGTTIPASNARRYTPGVFACWWASPKPPDKVLTRLVERSLRSGYGKMATAHFPFPALPVPLVETSLIAYNN
ncbi:MAG: hypothetical protein PHE09_16555 [Oscillospiraceae bacterium]|nr:hypothetical protein [Oscillospiraceae bacterium]